MTFQKHRIACCQAHELPLHGSLFADHTEIPSKPVNGEKEPQHTLPEEFLLLRYGENAYTKNGLEAAFCFSEADAKNVLSEFNRRGRDLVIDYEHQSLSGEKAPAAGWIDQLILSAEGLSAHVRYWTEEAAAMLLRGEYRYFSPTLYFSRSGKNVSSLHSVALTNHPAMHGIPALTADDADSADVGLQEDADFYSSLSLRENHDNPKENLMEKTITPDEKDILPTGSGKDPGRQTTVKPDSPTPHSLPPEEKASTASSGDTKTEKTPASQESVENLESEVRELIQKVHTLLEILTRLMPDEALEANRFHSSVPSDQSSSGVSDTQALVDQAYREGKLSAFQRKWAETFAKRDPSAFQDWLHAAPRIIPDNGNIQQATPARSLKPHFSDEQLQIFKLLGTDPAEMLKISGKEAGF